MAAARTPLDGDFAKLARDALDRWKVPGLSIAVVDGDETWAEGYGLAELPSTKATASTLYPVGSTSKAFTAAALSILVDEGRLKWDTPIADLIRDDFVVPDAYLTANITVEDALCHRTGMGRHDLFFGGPGAANAKEITRSLRHLPPVAPFRTKWIYTNHMYVVAQHVVETVSQSTLEDFLASHFFRPLGMTSTCCSIAQAQNASNHLCHGYYHDPVTGRYEDVPNLELYPILGAGGIVSNVLDYTKWIRAINRQGPPISKSGHRAMRSPRTIKPRPQGVPDPFTGVVQYCLGWETLVYHGQQVFMHRGGTEAHGATLICIPALDYGTIAFGNTAITARYAQDVLVWHLIDEKLRVPPSERFDWNRRGELELRLDPERVETALHTFYPAVASPKLPPSLPFEAYQGTYLHPAYGEMNVRYDGETLRIRRDRATWKIEIAFTHVSGEHFLGRVQSLNNLGRDLFAGATIWPAEFRIGAEGVAKEVGMRIEDEMGAEKIWFQRVREVEAN